MKTVMVVVPTARPPAWDLARALAQVDGWQVVLVVPEGDAAGVPEGDVGLQVYRLARGRDLRRIIRTVRPALVNLHTPWRAPSGLAALAGDVPFVVSWHGGRSPAERRMLARAAWIVCDSDLVRDTDLKAVRAKVSVVPPGDGQAASTSRIFESILAGRTGDGRPRLAVVAPYFHPRMGGVEQYAYHVALGLNRDDAYEVVVLTSNHDGRRTLVEVVDGLTVFRFPRWLTVSNTPVNPLWPLALRRAMTANRVDLVHAHSPVPFMAEAAAMACGRRPLALTYHCSLPKGRRFIDPFLRFYEARILPLLLNRADAVVTVSPPVAGWLMPHSAGKAHLIPPGVDDGVFVPRPPAPAPRPTILYVGRIERASAEKGLRHLLEAFALVRAALPTAGLVLVGAGDALEDYRRLAARLGILDGVDFRGRVSLEALVEAYQEASVVVLPSTSHSESFGMVLIEAMACAKPVIGSDVGGIPFVIDQGRDGCLVPPADSCALAAACLDILRSPDLGATLGEAGYRKVKARFTWPAQVDKYQAIFDALLGAGALPPDQTLEPLPGQR